MKASVALALLVICAVPAVAQKNKKEIVMPELPKNESTGLISYAGKEEVASTPKTVLYERALAWANSFYKNPADVIRLNNAIKSAES